MLNHDWGNVLPIDSRAKITDPFENAEQDDYVSFYHNGHLCFVRIKDAPEGFLPYLKDEKTGKEFLPFVSQLYLVEEIPAPPTKLKPSQFPQDAELEFEGYGGKIIKMNFKYWFKTESHVESFRVWYVWEMNKHGYMIQKGLLMNYTGMQTDHEKIEEYYQIILSQEIKKRIGDYAHNLRFKDGKDNSFNILVGESSYSMLGQYSLDIPNQHFVLPYVGGVTFINRNRTNYLTFHDGKYHWFSFGENATRLHFLPPFTLEDISLNGRINPESVNSWICSIYDKLKADGLKELFIRATTGNDELSPHCIDDLIVGLAPATIEGVFNHYQWSFSNKVEFSFDGLSAKHFNTIAHFFIMDLLMVCCLNDSEMKTKVLKKGVKSISNPAKTKKGLRYWRWGQNGVEYVYPKSNKHSSKKIRRHWVRGHIKNQRITYPENHPGSYERNGFHYVVKVISPHMRGGNASLDREILNSPLCFGGIGNNHAGGSHIASRWVRKIESELGRKLQHKENGGEKRIPIGFGNRWYYLDAWDKETNTAYEFHGDYYHGNPNVYAAEEYNNKTKKTMGEMYEATLQKKQWLEENGYNYVCVWESDFNNGMMKSDL